MYVGDLVSGSSAFSKSSLYIWNFSVHVLPKPSLKDFKHYFASMWNERNYMVVWTFLALPSFGIGMKTDLFQSCGHCWVFQIFWHVECSTLIASSFRILNSSFGILSAPLALFIVMLPKAHLTSLLEKYKYQMLEGVWRKGNLSTLGGNVNWCSHYGEQYAGSIKN